MPYCKQIGAAEISITLFILLGNASGWDSNCKVHLEAGLLNSTHSGSAVQATNYLAHECITTEIMSDIVSCPCVLCKGNRFLDMFVESTQDVLLQVAMYSSYN